MQFDLLPEHAICSRNSRIKAELKVLLTLKIIARLHVIFPYNMQCYAKYDRKLFKAMNKPVQAYFRTKGE